MKDEIKEILEYIQKYTDEYETTNLTEIRALQMGYVDTVLLLDYITNLQEENEELREDNFAYHQLMKMQNKREYRSKFLKDFQKEHGRNVFPDYDEIYKRYDNYKTRNDKAVDMLNLIIPELWNISNAMTYKIQDVRRVLQGKSDE